MTLENWVNNGWLRHHKTSPEEIKNLLLIVERDVSDANKKNLSIDWRFGIAYNAALKLCTILLYAEGYRPERDHAHYHTIQILPVILGTEKNKDATYLNTCRIKRNQLEYNYIGGVTEADTEELIQFVTELRIEVKNWLKKNHRNLV